MGLVVVVSVMEGGNLVKKGGDDEEMVRR